MGKCALSNIGFDDYKRIMAEDVPLSDLDRRIFAMSCRGCSVVEISMETNCSTSTVVRRRASLARRMKE